MDSRVSFFLIHWYNIEVREQKDEVGHYVFAK